MLHISKDFLGIAPYQANYGGAYFMAMFLRGVLGFTQVGHTNFNIDSGSMVKASGSAADVNLGSGLERAVLIPSATYVVSSSDVSRILVLKSTSSPLFNSGLFRITGVDTTNNRLFVSPRMSDYLKVETGLTWKIFENETVVDSLFDDGAATPSTGNTYHGTGNATASRIILQSPHSTGWQVRITCENTVDVNPSTVGTRLGAALSVAPGFDGNSSGDFQPGGKHLHIPLWWNKVNLSLTDTIAGRTNGTLPGIQSRTDTTAGVRYYMWGEDSTGTFCMIVRDHGHSTTIHQGILFFGIPEDEEIYSPSENVHRLFSYGNTAVVGDTNIPITIVPEFAQTSDAGQMGVAFGLSMQPVTCVPSSYCYLAGNANGASIMHNASSGDGVYSQATELYGLDLIAGTWDAVNSTGQTPGLVLEPRRMGRMPFVRKGRTNFNDWSTSPDGLWLHTQNGVYMPWSGSFIP